jgi:hypothetical protein
MGLLVVVVLVACGGGDDRTGSNVRNIGAADAMADGCDSSSSENSTPEDDGAFDEAVDEVASDAIAPAEGASDGIAPAEGASDDDASFIDASAE